MFYSLPKTAESYHFRTVPLFLSHSEIEYHRVQWSSLTSWSWLMKENFFWTAAPFLSSTPKRIKLIKTMDLIFSSWHLYTFFAHSIALALKIQHQALLLQETWLLFGPAPRALFLLAARAALLWPFSAESLPTGKENQGKGFSGQKEVLWYHVWSSTHSG